MGTDLLAGRKLTARQERFVAEYLVGLNGTQAAIRAGYARKTANRESARLLSNVGIRARIDGETAARLDRLKLTADQVLAEAGLIAASDLSEFLDANGHLLPLGRLPVHARRSIASIKVSSRAGGKERVTEIKLWNKNQALDLVAKHLGLLRERTETEQHGEVHVHHHYANLDEDDGADTGTG